MKSILSNKYLLMISGFILGGVFIFAGMRHFMFLKFKKRMINGRNSQSYS